MIKIWLPLMSYSQWSSIIFFFFFEILRIKFKEDLCWFSYILLLPYILFLVFFFFLESFNIWRSLLMIALYHQTKTPISFWYRQGLNLRFLIQPLKTLLIKLIKTQLFCRDWTSDFLYNHQRRYQLS